MANDATVADFFVGIGADFTEFDKSFKLFGMRLKGAMSDLASAVQPLAIAATAAGGAIFLAAKQTAKYADEIGMMATRTGLGTDKLEELHFISGQLDFDFKAIQSSVSAFTVRLNSMDQESSDTNVALKGLGISVTDANGNFRTMDELFPSIITKLSEIQNKTERNAAAAAIFGRGWSELAPLLDAGSGKIADLTARAHTLGIVLGKDGIDTARDFDDQLDELQARLAALTRQLSIETIPTIVASMKFIMPVVISVVQGISSTFNALAGSFASAMQFINDVLAALQTGANVAAGFARAAGMEGLANAYTEIAQLAGDAAMNSETWGKVADEAFGKVQASGDKIIAAWKEAGVALDALAKGTDGVTTSTGLLNKATEEFTPQWILDIQAANEVLAEQAALLKEINEDIMLSDALLPQWKQDWDEMGFSSEKFNNTIADLGTELVRMNVEGIKSMKDFGNAVLGTAKRIISAYIAEGVAGAVKNALSSVPFPWNLVAAGTAGAAAAALFSALVPSFATGGLAFGPTLAMIGDNPGASHDPEVVAPLSKLQGMGSRRIDVYVHGEIDGRMIKLITDRVEEDLVRI